MKNPGWVNVQTKRCVSCRKDFPRRHRRCPVCGGPLVNSTSREPAASS